jgi:hypothetical protein
MQVHFARDACGPLMNSSNRPVGVTNFGWFSPHRCSQSSVGARITRIITSIPPKSTTDRRVPKRGAPDNERQQYGVRTYS